MRAPAARTALVVVAVVVATLPACLGPGNFHCQQPAQCGANAFCEADGRCSVAETAGACPSHRRYVHSAGGASDACVPDSCPANPIGAVSAGGAHACVARQDGRVQCWGRNDDGQLGDGTRTPRSVAVDVGGVDATAVAAGQRHTCAAAKDQRVLCWGADDLGQLGDGGGPDRLSPAVVTGVSGALSVAAGADFSCAVLAGGAVTCWGDDSLGQLGDGGAAATTHLPSPVLGLDGVVALSAFSQHACAVRGDGSLWCWGANAQGQLGDGTTTNQKRPVQVPTLTAVAAVGTGLSHTCAIANGGATASARLYCWGSNASSQLGNGGGSATDPPATVPMPVPIVTDPIAVAVGAQHSCVVRQNGTIFCWGQNGSGQVGQGPTPVFPSPVEVPVATGATSIVAGSAFSCATTTDDAVFCWGDNHYGQLGMGSGTIQTRPIRVPDVSQAKVITAGAGHTCVATAAGDGHPVCWGADQAGQLGDADTTDRAHEEPIQGDISATEISAGGAHTCAVATTPAASLWCWGRGSAGQLGLGAMRLFDVKQPSQLLMVSGATGVAAGAAHSCAVTGDGVVCFGTNANGQLGDGTTVDRSLPVAAPLGAGPSPPLPVAVSAGTAHSCALDVRGQVWCWGRGTDGELGDGILMDRSIPVAVPLGAGVRATNVSAGGAHTCAITAAGELFCWGRGVEGQLGTTAPSAPSPVHVLGVSGARDVASGAAHTCAIDAGRTVICFGANDDGQLGDGTTLASATPVKVEGLSDAYQISAGAAHTCVRRGDGSVWCWGADTSGQLGDGVVLTSITPQLARIPCQ